MSFKCAGIGESREGIPEIGNPRLFGVVVSVSGDITFTLPRVATHNGKILILKKTDSNATTVTVDGYGSETIDGQTSIALTEQYEVLRLFCDGLVWHII